jgi:hypothetical protein
MELKPIVRKDDYYIGKDAWLVVLKWFLIALSIGIGGAFIIWKIKSW